MSVKFKVRFTMSGETVFALIAKMLPIEDLEVEEVPVKSLAERAIAIHKIAHKPKGMPMKLDSGINKVEDLEVEEVPVKSLAERAIAIHKIAHKPKGKGSAGRRPMNLDSGINKVILEALSSGPKRALELQIPIKAGGWSVSSVNSRLEFLRVRGIVVRVGDGTWRKAS